MLPGQPSTTLLRAAMRRAAHQLLDQPPIFVDPVALRLLPQGCDARASERLAGESPALSQLLRGLMAMRSRFAEDRLARALRQGARQYLMLGAGLDTFAWRQPPNVRNIRIFAADHPASLAWSLRLAAERGLGIPSNLFPVAVDLEAQDVGHELAKSGFDRDAVTFCSLLGLLQYLDESAIGSLVCFLGTLASRSEVVCSFVLPDTDLNGEDGDLARIAAARAAGAGEPWKTRLRADALMDLLEGIGYNDIFHLTPEIAQLTYFNGRRDGLRAPVLEQLLAACRS